MDLGTQVTHTNLIDYADGMSLYFETLERPESETETRRRLLDMSKLKLESFCASSPGNYQALLQLGSVFVVMGKVVGG